MIFSPELKEYVSHWVEHAFLVGAEWVKTRPLGHASATFEKEGKVHILSVFFGGGEEEQREEERKRWGRAGERERAKSHLGWARTMGREGLRAVDIVTGIPTAHVTWYAPEASLLTLLNEQQPSS